MDPVISRLDRIEAKLDRALTKPAKEVLTPAECMPLTGCNAISSQFRWFKRHKVKPYARGKYRRIDITNTVSRLALFPANQP